MKKQIITNAHIITPKDDFIGTCIIENQTITDIIRDKFYPEGYDLEQSWLVPGCIDIHTDQLEQEISPRPGTEFSLASALHALDNRAVSNGITVLLNCLRFSEDTDKENWMRDDSIAKAGKLEQLTSNTMARHFVQARWDTNFEKPENLLNQVKQLEGLKLLVYNENIPGQRQFRDLDVLSLMYAQRRKVSVEQGRQILEDKIKRNRGINNRPQVYEKVNGSLVIGSHDDTTREHVLEAYEYGSTLAEMPTTMEAAKAAKELDMWVCMSATNYLRGGSTYGNLSSEAAMNENCVDMLCSDFHFPSMLGALAKMIQKGMRPSASVAYFSLKPARLLGIDDTLGSIEIGKTADLVACTLQTDFAKVSRVWVGGRQVCSNSTNS